MILIDTHFHLDMYKTHNDIFDEINRLKQYTLCVTCSPSVYLSCKKLYPETKYIKFALGIHPREIHNTAQAISEFDHCFSSAKYIGEVGLDYGINLINRESQINVFKHIMQKQSISNKPISIHIRKAESDAIEILKKTPGSKRIIHWYTGNNVFLHEFIRLGCYFSINTSMIRNKKQRELLSTIPHDRLLIESDGPFIVISGGQYKPSMLGDIYLAVADALSISDLHKTVYDNFASLLK